MCTEFGHRLPVNDDRGWESNKGHETLAAAAVDAIEGALDDSSQVYVYSDTGYGAATVMVAYLVMSRYDDAEAILHVQSVWRGVLFEHLYGNCLNFVCEPFLVENNGTLAGAM
jgi:hypothetical protein